MLVAHGADDQLIPLSHARSLAAVNDDATLVVLEGGHNDVPRSWPDFWVEVDRVLEKAWADPKQEFTGQQP